MSGCLATLIVLAIAIAVFAVAPQVFIVVAIVLIIYKIYEALYFRSSNFIEIKDEIKAYIDECNELNQHIEDLKRSDSAFGKTDYGVAELRDTSKFSFKRKELDKFSNAKHVYNCSLSVCRNAQKQPFKYICKYFNIDKNEENLEHFEELLNNFSAIEDGKVYLTDKREKIMAGIGDRLPFLIKKISRKKLEEKLGFEEVDFSDSHYPTYNMQYISDGGNSSMEARVIFNLGNLEKFINYLSDHIKWRKSVAGQRALMTPSLRESIKARDHYTCCYCDNSPEKEPNLLLEIDHIIPLSKGGMTEVDNLQTLCWKCNRSKGAKILDINKTPIMQ